MAQWDIPHDERHRFLDWGPRDDVFKGWTDYLDELGVPYEVGGGKDKWTIYKHMLKVQDELDHRRYRRCCPMDGDL
jgi:hypothetical protein